MIPLGLCQCLFHPFTLQNQISLRKAWFSTGFLHFGSWEPKMRGYVILLVGGRVWFRCCSKCVHSCPSYQELSKFCLMLAKSSCSLEVGTCSTCSSVRTAAEATPMLMVIWVINEHIHMVWANFALIAKCMVYCSVYCLDKIWWDIPPQRIRHMQHTHIHLETPRRETMKWDEMRIHVSSCWVFGFAQLPYWDYCRYTRLIRPCIPLQGIASLHWVCQGVPNAPARWYTNSKRTIETHVLHAWRCTDVSDWNLYATWTSSR